jgi:hypothetical protein
VAVPTVARTIEITLEMFVLAMSRVKYRLTIESTNTIATSIPMPRISGRNALNILQMAYRTELEFREKLKPGVETPEVEEDAVKDEMAEAITHIKHTTSNKTMKPMSTRLTLKKKRMKSPIQMESSPKMIPSRWRSSRISQSKTLKPSWPTVEQPKGMQKPSNNMERNVYKPLWTP